MICAVCEEIRLFKFYLYLFNFWRRIGNDLCVFFKNLLNKYRHINLNSCPA